MSTFSKYLPQFVYGATDGTITTFAIVSSVVGAGLSPAIILLLGTANVLADGFSMASSNYLSIKSDPQDETKALSSALVTFFSFIVVGTIPLIPFIYGLIAGSDPTSREQFIQSIIATTIAFALSGYIRGKVNKQSVFRTIAETLVVGGIAAYIAYLVGYLLKGIA